MIYARVVTITDNSGKLTQRISGLSLMQDYLTESLDKVVNSYAGVEFRNSNIDKSIFFNECLKLKLSAASERLIAERCKLSFHKDMRSSIEYGLDLVFGWLSEDLILAALQRNGISVHLAGQDRYREFLLPHEIGTKSDFRLDINGVSRPLEIVVSWNDHWIKTDKWDLRDSKFWHLVRTGEESLCLGIELPSLEGFLIDMKHFKDSFIQRKNPAWGNKNCFTLSEMRNILKKLEFVFEDFKKILV